MRRIKLKFIGIYQTCIPENSYTCVLAKSDDLQRKIFVNLTTAEADAIFTIVENGKNESVVDVPDNLKEFISKGYKIQETHIDYDKDKQFGSIIIQNGKEKLKFLSTVFLSILFLINDNIPLSVNENIFGTILGTSRKIVNNALCTNEIENLGQQLDEAIKREDCYAIKTICEKLKFNNYEIYDILLNLF